MSFNKIISSCFCNYTEEGAMVYVNGYFDSCVPDNLSEQENLCIRSFLTLFKAIKQYTHFIPWESTKKGIKAAINTETQLSSNPFIELANNVMNMLKDYKDETAYVFFQKKFNAFLDHFTDRPNDRKEGSLELRRISNAVEPFIALLELILAQQENPNRDELYILTSEIVALITDGRYEPLDAKGDEQNMADNESLKQKKNNLNRLPSSALKTICQQIISGVSTTQTQLLQPENLTGQFPSLPNNIGIIMEPGHVFKKNPCLPVPKKKSAKQQGIYYLLNHMPVTEPFQASVNATKRFKPEHAENVYVRYGKEKGLGPGINTEFFSSLLIWDILSEMELEIPSGLKNNVEQFCFQTFSTDGFCFFNEPKFPKDSDVTGIALSTYLKDYELADKALLKLAQLFIDTTDKGVIKVYYNPGKHYEGIDHVVCCNALSGVLALLNNEYIQSQTKVLSDLENIKEKTLTHIIESLSNQEEFYGGSPYYPSPDVFLYFAARLFLLLGPDDQAKLCPILTIRIQERTVNCLSPSRSHLEQACLIIAQRYLKLSTPCELAVALYHKKEINGFWDTAPIYKTRTQDLFFGSSYVSTAFAIHAADLYEKYVTENNDTYDIPSILYPWEHYRLTEKEMMFTESKLVSSLMTHKKTILTFIQCCSSKMESDAKQDVFSLKIKFLVLLFALNDLDKKESSKIINEIDDPKSDYHPLYKNFIDSFEEPQKSKIKAVLTRYLEAVKEESAPDSLGMNMETYDTMRIQLIGELLWLKITFFSLNLESTLTELKLKNPTIDADLEEIETLAARCLYIDNDNESVDRSHQEKRPTIVSVYYQQFNGTAPSSDIRDEKTLKKALRHTRADHGKNRDLFLEKFDLLYSKLEDKNPLKGYLIFIKNTLIGNFMAQKELPRYK